MGEALHKGSTECRYAEVRQGLEGLEGGIQGQEEKIFTAPGIEAEGLGVRRGGECSVRGWNQQDLETSKMCG